jgi:hypothetical protein
MIALWDSQAGWTEAALIAAAVIILAGVLLLQPGEPTFPPAGPAEGTAQRASRVLRIVKQGGEPCPPQRRTYDAGGTRPAPPLTFWSCLANLEPWILISVNSRGDDDC